MQDEGTPVLTMPDLANPIEIVEKIVYVDRPIEVIKFVEKPIEVVKYIDRIKTIRKSFIPSWIKIVSVLEALAIIVLLLK